VLFYLLRKEDTLKQVIVVGVLVLGGMFAWLLGSKLSSDALGMGVGVIFGVLAGVPTALLVMASQQRQQRRPYDDDDDYHPAPYGRLPDRQYQPPVIVLAAPREEQPRNEVHYHYHQAGPPAIAQREAELARYQGGA
jgi:preprotein translocase subunit SecY